MNLEKYVNEKGLIPCKVLKGFDIYRSGTIAGFELKFVRGAGGLLAMGKVEIVGAEVEPEKAAEADEPEVATIIVGTPGGDLEIPVAWKDEHHMARINWAKKIEPETTDMNADKADEIIAKAVAAEE